MPKDSRVVFFLTKDSLVAAHVHSGAKESGIQKVFPFGEAGMAGALKAAKQQFGQGARMILPEEHLYVTQLELNATGTHLRPVLEKKIIEVFPETLGTIAWDYELIQTTAAGAVVELSGVVHDFGEQLQQALQDAGYRLEALIPESYALARLIPKRDTVFLVHEKGDGWILMVAAEQHVVTALFLHQTPTDEDVKKFLGFVANRKKVSPQRVIFSLLKTKMNDLPKVDLPREVLTSPLSPLLGAAQAVLGTTDADRMDLPLRQAHTSWFSQMVNFFRGV